MAITGICGIGRRQTGASDLHRIRTGRGEYAAVVDFTVVVGRLRRIRVHGNRAGTTDVVVFVRRLRRAVIQRFDFDFSFRIF